MFGRARHKELNNYNKLSVDPKTLQRVKFGFVSVDLDLE